MNGVTTQELSVWSELLNTAMLCGSALVAVGAAEAARFVFGVRAELTRKLAHFGAGMAVVFAPWQLETTWAPLAAAVAFFVFMAGTKRLGLLQSVHGIKRDTSGAAFYPLGVGAAILFAGGHTTVFNVAVAVMATSDALAALVGESLGRRRYRVWKQWRSLEGSSAFFASAFAVVALGVWWTGAAPELALATALLVAAVTTACEALSPGGSDNVVVPLVALGLLRALDGVAAATVWPWGNAAACTLVVLYLFRLGGRAEVETAATELEETTPEAG